MGDSDTSIVVTDALGDEIVKLPRLGVEKLLSIPPNAAAGDVLLKVQLDPYENSLRHAGTYLLVERLTQSAVWDALDRGRSFVAFDWIADAQGFSLAAVQEVETQSKRHEIGSQLSLTDGPIRLEGVSPLSATWKLFRNGETVETWVGSDCRFDIRQPGVYRVELWLDGGEDPLIWILTSPVYIT